MKLLTTHAYLRGNTVKIEVYDTHVSWVAVWGLPRVLASLLVAVSTLGLSLLVFPPSAGKSRGTIDMSQVLGIELVRGSIGTTYATLITSGIPIKFQMGDKDAVKFSDTFFGLLTQQTR